MEKKVVLMCKENSCCPELTISDDNVVIRDDFEGKVTLTHDQFDVLKEKIQKGEL